MSTQQKFFDMPTELDFERWREELQVLSHRDQTTQWDIGDLLLDAENHLGLGEQEDWTSSTARKYKREAVRITKKNWTTLKNYKSISRKFPKCPEDGSPSLRSDTLSYSAYALIAPFSREHQVKLLEKAEKQKVTTVNDMRTLIQREQKWGGVPKPNKTGPTKPIFLKIKVSIEEENQLLSLARAKNFAQGAAQALWWMAMEYAKEHIKELKAEVAAYKAAREADQKRIDEENEARLRENEESLKRMDEELAADVDNKIPSY